MAVETFLLSVKVILMGWGPMQLDETVGGPPMKLLLATVLALSSTVILTNNASAQATRPPAETIGSDPFAAMQEFVRCSARYEYAAGVAQSAGAKAVSEQYLGVARGANIAATFFANVVALKATADDIDEHEKAALLRYQQVKDFSHLEQTRLLALAEVEEPALDEDAPMYCQQLQTVQSQIIDMLRREGPM